MAKTLKLTKTMQKQAQREADALMLEIPQTDYYKLVGVAEDKEYGSVERLHALEVVRLLTLKIQTARNAYERLCAEAEEFMDTCCDHENIPASVTEASIGYWPALFAVGASAAGMRAEDAGVNLNKKLGWAVY